MTLLNVVIPVSHNWPTSDELNARNAVIRQLKHIGTSNGAGGGCGQMDFALKVSDEIAARRAIDTAIQQHFPGRKYSVVARQRPGRNGPAAGPAL